MDNKTTEFDIADVFAETYQNLYNSVPSEVTYIERLKQDFTYLRVMVSVYLFIIAIETLACLVRNDNTIKEIKIDNKEIKISLLADDITMIKTPIQTLGIVITDNDDKNYNYNFQNKIADLKTTLNILKQRKLSIKGKIIIPNNLAINICLKCCFFLNNLALAPLISSVVSF